MSDQPPKSRASAAGRTSRNESAGRAPRSAEADAARGGQSLLSEEDLRANVRSEFSQEALPQLRAPGGWHYCWLSTMSQHDAVHKRMRLGYVPVSLSELAEQGQASGMQTYKGESAEFAGAVTCNEMILFKISDARYQIIMAEFHHNMPLNEEQGLRRTASAEDAAPRDRNGKPLVGFTEDDSGMAELGRATRVPEFT